MPIAEKHFHILCETKLCFSISLKRYTIFVSELSEETGVFQTKILLVI